MSRAPGAFAFALVAVCSCVGGASCTTFGAEADLRDGGPEGGAVVDSGGVDAGGGVVTSETVLASFTKPWYLAKDGDVLFVTSYEDAGLWRVSATEAFKTSKILSETTFGVTFDDSYVYACAPGAKVLLRSTKAGAEKRTVATGGCLEVVWTADKLFVSSDLGVKTVARSAFGSPAEFSDVKKAEGLATDGTHLFLTVVNGGSPNGVFSKMVEEPNVAMKSTITTSPGRRIAVDGQHVYWLEYSDPTVKRATKPNGAVEDFAKGPAGPAVGGLTLDATYVYWVASEQGDILRARKDRTGSVETIAQGRKRPIDVVVDDRYVYFTEENANQVVRIPKPATK